ncbi:hypothetical protein K3169_25300 [Pseudomonas phytophila]|uniref:Uncharacterized protein n=1 Tax=Pseudomonas phytophila TaxID=2867264 RepID=A0ABY6FCK9_9PSED|nr:MULTISPECIES: hypothetical protein [Pseudomonas]MCQ2995798.1 hypothetical protein [Pseudomonas syringae]MCD5971493.1 hypothetical protein [Pseudomonas quasicaspiana]MCD5980490.1 hypothetical protein [Pseudomonas quasicaspiana]MCD5988666.1 hypothetical protein [Pseudomonas quasicaspiana]MCQ3033050.1 hypothetical protein [Pseudomonas syringae]
MSVRFGMGLSLKSVGQSASRLELLCSHRAVFAGRFIQVQPGAARYILKATV